MSLVCCRAAPSRWVRSTEPLGARKRLGAPRVELLCDPSHRDPKSATASLNCDLRLLYYTIPVIRVTVSYYFLRSRSTEVVTNRGLVSLPVETRDSLVAQLRVKRPAPATT